MGKQWYQIERNRVYGIIYVQRMDGYHIVAQQQLFTDVAYTDAEIIAMVNALTPQTLNGGATPLDRWFAGAASYDKIREPTASDPMPRLGGVVEPEPLDVLDTLADARLVAFSRQYHEQHAEKH